MRAWAIMAAVLGVASAAAGDTRIELRRWAQVPPGDGPRLRDVALVTGDDAEALGARVVGASVPDRVTLEDVRRSLDEAGGVNWGRVALEGSACEIRAGGVREPDEGDEGGEDGEPRDELTRRVRDRVAADLGLNAREVRVEIDPSSRGEEFAEREALGTGVVEIRPLGRGDRIGVRVTTYEGERVARTRVVRVEVRVRVEACVSTRAIARGEVVEDAWARRTMWLAPSVAREADPEPAGARARSAIAPGEVLLARSLEHAPAVRRGDVVTLDAIRGSFKVEIRVRARGDAHAGDEAEFETLDADRRDRRTHRGRVTGPGRAVRILEAEP